MAKDVVAFGAICIEPVRLSFGAHVPRFAIGAIEPSFMITAATAEALANKRGQDCGHTLYMFGSRESRQQRSW